MLIIVHMWNTGLPLLSCLATAKWQEENNLEETFLKKYLGPKPYPTLFYLIGEPIQVFWNVFLMFGGNIK